MSVPISKVFWVSTSEALGRIWTWPSSTPHSITKGSKGQPLLGLRNIFKCRITCTLCVIFLFEEPTKKKSQVKILRFLHNALLASCAHDLWRKSSSQIEEFGISFWVTDGWSLLSLLLKLPALFQLPVTSFVFPLSLTRFSIDLTLLDAVFRKAVGNKEWGFSSLFQNIVQV